MSSNSAVSTEQRIRVLRSRYEGCFGCGLANPIGLNLNGFSRNGDEVRVGFTPQRDHAGFNDVVHGGIIATALDEVMAWTAILTEETLVVTGTLDLRFIKPVTPDREYELVGRLEERRGRRLLITAALCDDGGALAQASGKFFAVGNLSELES